MAAIDLNTVRATIEARVATELASEIQDLYKQIRGK